MAHYRVWKAKPPADREAEFEHAYSSTGDWVDLFQKAPGYQGTSLLRPSEANGWWFTIDRWDDRADFESFVEVFGEQYRSLDAELEGIAGRNSWSGLSRIRPSAACNISAARPARNEAAFPNNIRQHRAHRPCAHRR